MDNYVTGSLIKKIRESKNITQAKLASDLMISEKTVSKWETGRGLPDISLIEPLAKALNVSVVELLNGKQIINQNRSSNLLKMNFYVCPVCGNVINSLGAGFFSCCGIELAKEEADNASKLVVEESDGRLFLSVDSPMTKSDYVSFFAYLTTDNFKFVKLYPEQNCEVSFEKMGHGMLLYYDNHNGLFKKQI